MALVPKRKLPRLKRHNYTGHAVVFWTLTLENRSRGWLTHNFNSKFREMMPRMPSCHQFSCLLLNASDHMEAVWKFKKI